MLQIIDSTIKQNNFNKSTKSQVKFQNIYSETIDNKNIVYNDRLVFEINNIFDQYESDLTKLQVLDRLKKEGISSILVPQVTGLSFPQITLTQYYLEKFKEDSTIVKNLRKKVVSNFQIESDSASSNLISNKLCNDINHQYLIISARKEKFKPIHPDKKTKYLEIRIYGVRVFKTRFFD